MKPETTTRTIYLLNGKTIEVQVFDDRLTTVEKVLIGIGLFLLMVGVPLSIALPLWAQMLGWTL